MASVAKRPAVPQRRTKRRTKRRVSSSRARDAPGRETDQLTSHGSIPLPLDLLRRLCFRHSRVRAEPRPPPPARASGDARTAPPAPCSPPRPGTPGFRRRRPGRPRPARTRPRASGTGATRGPRSRLSPPCAARRRRRRSRSGARPTRALKKEARVLAARLFPDCLAASGARRRQYREVRRRRAHPARCDACDCRCRGPRPRDASPRAWRRACGRSEPIGFRFFRLGRDASPPRSRGSRRRRSRRRFQSRRFARRPKHVLRPSGPSPYHPSHPYHPCSRTRPRDPPL